MAELTSSTREAARRLGVSDTTMHKAERTGRIAREADGQWDAESNIMRSAGSGRVVGSVFERSVTPHNFRMIRFSLGAHWASEREELGA